MRESSPTTSYFPTPPTTFCRSSPLRSIPSPPTRSSDERANASLSFPLVSLFCLLFHSFFLSSFLSPFLRRSFPRPVSTFRPLARSVFVHCSLDFSITPSFSQLLLSHSHPGRSPFSCHLLRLDSPSLSRSRSPLSTLPFSSDSSWRVSSPLWLRSRAYARSACVQYRVACKDEELNKLLKAVTCHVAAGVYTPKGYPCVRTHGVVVPCHSKA